MFGISSSIFNEAGGLVRGWLKNPLNAAFFYWYFLPAVGFVLLQLFIVGPALGFRAPRVFNVEVGSAKSAVDLILQILNTSFVALILVPLILGVLLSSLSGAVLRFYRGRLPIARALFRPWLKRNQKRSRQLYGPLPILRSRYFALVSQGAAESDPAAIDQVKQEIQTLHENLEQKSMVRELPVDAERVGATSLANTLALAEEYAIERYSIDTTVFWPRLSAEIEKEKLESMTASFGAMNGLLNISLLSFFFTIESLFVGLAITMSPLRLPLLQSGLLFITAVAGIFVGIAAYRAAVSSARSVGNAMRTAFDYYRGNVLRRFNLEMPEDIEEERVVWLKLAAFIRRGESFYYPSEFCTRQE